MLPKSFWDDGAPYREGNAMLGLMQDWPLMCPRVIGDAAQYNDERKILKRSI
jgi:hypothetical protein